MSQELQPSSHIEVDYGADALLHRTRALRSAPRHKCLRPTSCPLRISCNHIFPLYHLPRTSEEQTRRAQLSGPSIDAQPHTRSQACCHQAVPARDVGIEPSNVYAQFVASRCVVGPNSHRQCAAEEYSPLGQFHPAHHCRRSPARTSAAGSMRALLAANNTQ